ncbi:MAG: flagellar basal body-associated FliL family protein [Thermodesulfobacteriota bacterium]|nr:flagellar basal body-associated FliL family protein [Thermodesulfobacteriota bacterium]
MTEKTLKGQGVFYRTRNGGIKIIIIAVVVVLILVGGALGVKFFAPGLIPGSAENASEEEAEAEGKEAGAAELGTLKPLKPFIVNLADPAGRRYLKLNMTLELDTPEAAAEIDTRMPQIRDVILILLSSMRFEDVRTIEGKMRLRGQIITRCNTVLTAGKVKNVFFSEFVVQ